MKFIPDIKIDSNVGEKKVFSLLKKINNPFFNNWYCFHSVYLPKHLKRISGEIDFVLLSENGLIGIEVKTGFKGVVEGEWIFETYKKKYSPLVQVNDSMHSLLSSLKNNNKLCNEFIPIGSCAIFPDRKVTYDTVEFPKELYCDAENIDKLEDFLVKVVKYYFKKKNLYKLNYNILINLFNTIRGNYVTFPSEQMMLIESKNKIIELTDQQLSLFNTLHGNDRILVEGEAGTGKTLIAKRFALSSVSPNKKVAFFCYSSLLATVLKNDFKDISPNIKILRVSSWLEYLYEKYGLNCMGDVEDYKLIELLNEYYMDEDKFDEVIIDEGQDILNNEYIYFLMDTILKGGISGGKWKFFFDSKAQSKVFNRMENDMLNELRNMPNVTKITLKENYRNTKNITNEIRLLTGNRLTNLPNSPEGVEVSIQSYNNLKDYEAKVISLIHNLGCNDNIDLLTIKEYSKSSLPNFEKKYNNFIRLNKKTIINREMHVGLSSVVNYKGLENDIIIIVDLENPNDEKEMALLYTAMTRAISKLYIFYDKILNKTLQNIYENNKEV